MKVKKIILSVIIPAYNAKKTIIKCLSALLNQTITNFEIIVVNDDSKDNTANIIETLIANKQSILPKIRLITLKKNSGASVARNEGANSAQTDTLVFLDSDCVPNQNWLNSLLTPLKEKGVVSVVSQYNRSLSSSFIAKFCFYELIFRDRNKKYESLDSASSCNFACRKTDFFGAGGFSSDRDAEPAEDVDFFFKLSKLGKIVFVENARVGHYFRDSFFSYFKQQKEYSRSAMYLFLKSYGNVFLSKNTLHDKTNYVEIFLTFLFYFFLIFSFFLFSAVMPLLIIYFYFFLIFLLNIVFLRYIFEKENLFFVLISLLTIIIRDFFWAIGIVIGVFQFIKKRLKRMLRFGL